MKGYDLSGKTALITGAAGGFGESMVELFLEHGANVTLADIDEKGSKELAEKFDPPKERTLVQYLDVTSSDSVKEALKTTEERFGSCEILINNAGITKRLEPLTYPEDVFDKIVAVNLKGTFLCSQAAANLMSKRGYGKIVNIASVGGMMGLPNTVAYCASKGGVVNMTRALAIDLAQYKISVNGIAPCSADTKISRSVYGNPDELAWFMSRIPMGRKCEPMDVAWAALFLSSPESDFITGHIMPVDGGWLCI
ncbi:MAG: SDR family oxidoreductase [Synergistaceae bacterium]|jgi:NAD(P)-dependent dehydrogenase (short-subunit alcohol dehydrogenase family)|nr:SDR family oxidoreductase [Synergistaceae bacterium]